MVRFVSSQAQGPCGLKTVLQLAPDCNAFRAPRRAISRAWPATRAHLQASDLADACHGTNDTRSP